MLDGGGGGRAGGGGATGGAGAGEQRPLPRVTPRAYTFTNRVSEAHGEPIYGLAFNLVDLRHSNVFATVGANRAHVYEAKPPPGCELRLLQCYADDDPEEKLYTLAWSLDESTGAPLLIVAGEKGSIKAIDCNAGECRRVLLGHGHAVNDLKVSPLRPRMLFSASKDEAIRVWDLRSGVCIMILAGTGGHKNEVLSCDLHPSGLRLASCGMDNTVCVWELERHAQLFEEAAVWEGPPGRFETRFVTYADFSTHLVHSNYVDCVRWVGDLLLTKSVDSRILMWRPVEDATRQRAAPQPPGWFESSTGLSKTLPLYPYGTGDAELLQQYVFADCSIWFMRFGLDLGCSTLAVGTVDGRVYVWDTRASPPTAPLRLSLPRCKRPVRMASPSADGRMVVACADNGALYRFDDSAALTSRCVARVAACAMLLTPLCIRHRRPRNADIHIALLHMQCSDDSDKDVDNRAGTHAPKASARANGR